MSDTASKRLVEVLSQIHASGDDEFIVGSS